MLEAKAVVATSSEHPIRSLKPELGIGTMRVVWAHCTAAHADAPPARALARGGSRYHHRPTSPPRVVAVALLLAPIHFLLLSLFTSICLAV